MLDKKKGKRTMTWNPVWAVRDCPPRNFISSAAALRQEIGT